MRRCLQLLLLLCLASSLLRADSSPFDLSGPKIDVHVKRGDVTLPVSEVAYLLPGDRLWVHPDLPESQAAHFVLVVVFLRGSTNPPPTEWFTRVETWSRQARDEGVFVTVPKEAQQALVFLAPETGGDFNTLRKAVHDEPGSFVRAAQDLQAASWERMRLENYLSDVKVTSQFDTTALKTRAEMAARSLGIKLNESCFNKPADQQASCLSQNSEGMVLDDANVQSTVNQLATGSALDLMNHISSTSMGGGGMYSAYIGAIVDTAKILGSLHTAHFQYIPALALPTSDTLNLRLNMPPSFRNPKSVVVVALPPVGPSHPEPLHPVNPEESFCALKPGLVLPATGAPLVFATQLTHGLVLHIEPGDDPKAHAVDVPVTADPVRGGLVPTQPIPALPGGELTGEIRGKWGFDDWTGPQYQLVVPQPGKWELAAADQTALVVGRDDTLHLDGESSVCVEKVEAETAGGHAASLTWKSPKPDTLEVVAPLKDVAPGPFNLAVYQYGLAKPDKLSMVAYEAAASLEGLTLSSGDKTALLKGTRLDEVAKAKVSGVMLVPASLNRVENLDELQLNVTGSTASLQPGKHYVANVELKDGRTLKVSVTVTSPRPRVVLLSKAAQEDPAAPPLPVQLGSPDDLPVQGRLVFFLKSTVPSTFPRDEKVEVAAADSSFQTTLDLGNGGLMLEDAQTAVASLEPLARFGSSAFGPVRVRVVSADGQASDWLPLGTLVRLPGMKELRCPRAVSRPCVLTGGNLFLVSSIATTPAFDNPTDVPPHFAGTQLIIPHSANGVLYVKLRDDPATVQTITLPVIPISLAESKATAAESQANPAPAATQEPEAPVTPPTAAPATPPATEQTPPAAQQPSATGEPAQPPTPSHN